MAALEKALGVDFAVEGDRYECRELLAALLERWFGQRDLAEVRAVLDRPRCSWSVYRDFAELVGSGELRANPMMSVVEQPGVGAYLAPASPIAAGPRTVTRAPVLGEHTDDVLADWLGMGGDEVRDLHDRAVIQSAPREG